MTLAQKLLRTLQSKSAILPLQPQLLLQQQEAVLLRIDLAVLA